MIDPDAQIVEGYSAGLIDPAIASFDLGQKPDDIRALVAFIKVAEVGRGRRPTAPAPKGSAAAPRLQSLV